MRNIPSRFRPKPYLWHAGAISLLFGSQLASDSQMLPRNYQAGPVKPFDHFGNVPTSVLLVMAGTYPGLALAEKIGIEPFKENPRNGIINKPKTSTKIVCTSAGAAIGAIANGLVETRWGLSQVQQVTDVYTNSMGVNGGTNLDFLFGTAAATIAGRVCASTFPSLKGRTLQSRV
jgi:hypothetical protein